MEITLRNGETITLDWNPMILEYLEEYDGGIEQLKKDIKSMNCKFRAFNSILYSVINAAYPTDLTYKEAVSLVDINDLEKIVNFLLKNINKNKKETKMSNKRPHRK